MRLLRAVDRRPTLWKNRGGQTAEIAVHPPGAGLDAFDWRVSTAWVGADGPFSTFPGVDRTLAVLTGAGLELTACEHAPAILTVASAPFGFSADVPCAARLIGGPVTDLNVMTRRGRFTHVVRHLDLSCRTISGPEHSTVLVFCRYGRIALGDEALGPGDAAIVEAGARLAALDASAAGLIATIRSA